MQFFDYEICGLKIRSQFNLLTADVIDQGGLRMLKSSEDIDIHIRFSQDIGEPQDIIFEDEWVKIGRQDFLLQPQCGLSFRIINGEEILISRSSKIGDDDINLFLIGSVWGVICHQRALLALHCSAIEYGGRAFAFTGLSGSGKSTLAAGLAKRGFAHLSDDVGIIKSQGEIVTMLAMPKGLKLWREAANALGYECGKPVGSDIWQDKYYVYPHISHTQSHTQSMTQNKSNNAPIKLAALYILETCDLQNSADEPTKAMPPEITQLRGGARMQGFHDSIYRVEWLDIIRDRKEVFMQLADYSNKIPLYKFSRTADITKFDEGLDMLEVHMANILDEKRAKIGKNQ